MYFGFPLDLLLMRVFIIYLRSLSPSSRNEYVQTMQFGTRCPLILVQDMNEVFRYLQYTGGP